jgi:hypothetical protein
MIGKDWMAEAAWEIYSYQMRVGREPGVNEICDIIAKHCPFKNDTADVEVDGGEEPLVQLVKSMLEPAVLETLAKLRALLRESKREHLPAYFEGKEICPKSWCGEGINSEELCNCGADTWNAKVEEALK